MALFKNPYYSHEHSLEILNLLYGYDSFLDNLTIIADMGCGAGFDVEWWATLETRDDPPEPHNYKVYAVDENISQIDKQLLADNKNIIPIEKNFEERVIPVNVDLIWSHDSFQYARDPFKCLASWKQTLNVNGMLIMAIPQTTYLYNGRLVVSNHNNQYYSYNILNLMYMLAMSGFDCRDAYFYRKENTPWLYVGVYASQHEPLPAHATWHDLADRNLINDSVINSINKYGYARLEDVVVCWFDKNLYQITN
ncbi:Methyltransferase type 11 [uncultured Caudovirales phage]|uniref:Methyltransferase type 11 n=1 Tax=uncultured Caudovirales phage TaxID=2100421 RepID=A0A6J5L6B3_9CAUD|nr:Methyltransferase type 11 [uncultured Caudovirales phage]